MTGPFPRASTIARIKSRLKRCHVDAAPDIETAMAQLVVGGRSIYVCMAERPGSRQEYTGGYIQPVDVILQCICMVNNVGAQTVGLGALKDMAQLLGALRSALIGWQPPDVDVNNALSLATYRDLTYANGRYVTQQDFATDYEFEVDDE